MHMPNIIAYRRAAALAECRTLVSWQSADMVDGDSCRTYTFGGKDDDSLALLV